MQLYKGDTSDRKINWTNPTALPVNKQLTSIDRGQVLFQQNCASCHSIEKDMTGPKLAHFPKRFGGLTWGAEGLPSYWYHGLPEPVSIERSVPADTIVHRKDSSAKNVFYDPDYKKLELYVCNLIQMYGARGTAFNFNRQEFIDLFKYIQNESDRMDLPLPGKEDLKNSIDSCVIYRKKINHLLNKKQKAQSKRNNLIEDNGPLVDKKPDTTWIVDNNAPLPLDFDKRVSPNNYDAVYYQFTVESFGWYNIDMLLKDVSGVEESELFVRVVGQYKEKIKIFLIIPGVKVYAEGGPAEKNPEEFAFFYKNGKLPLPQNVTAYVLAVTETEQSIAFGIKKFTTGKQQEFDISLHTSSKEEFMSAVSEFDSERLHIKVDNAKNADEIRKTDAALKKIDENLKNVEKLKPKRCDCDCGGLSQK
jgi:hypothetical protein